MMLWEITVATAYFLGLKRTYRLALKAQRRLIGPKHPKIRHFVQRRTRAVFDVAFKVHQNIQHRDIEVGRSLGNWILRWLDKMKPSAQIRGSLAGKPLSGDYLKTNVTKNHTNSSHLKTPGGSKRFSTSGFKESGKYLYNSSRNMWPKPFPTIAMMMRPAMPAGINIQYRRLSYRGPGPEVSQLNHRQGAFGRVIREDIMQWMLKN